MKRNQYLAAGLAVLLGTLAGMPLQAFAKTRGYSIDMTNLNNEAWQHVAMTNDDMVTTGVYIREKADKNSKVMGYLYRGGAVTVVDKGQEWSEVESGGVHGYVHNDYLVFGTEAKGLAEYYGNYGVTASWNDVKVFLWDDPSATIVSTANHGDTYEIVNNNGHWIEVKTSEKETAYVSSEDVSMVILVDTAVPVDDTEGQQQAMQAIKEKAPYQAQPAQEPVAQEAVMQEAAPQNAADQAAAVPAEAVVETVAAEAVAAEAVTAEAPAEAYVAEAAQTPESGIVQTVAVETPYEPLVAAAVAEDDGVEAEEVAEDDGAEAEEVAEDDGVEVEEVAEDDGVEVEEVAEDDGSGDAAEEDVVSDVDSEVSEEEYDETSEEEYDETSEEEYDESSDGEYVEGSDADDGEEITGEVDEDIVVADDNVEVSGDVYAQEDAADDAGEEVVYDESADADAAGEETYEDTSYDTASDTGASDTQDEAAASYSVSPSDLDLLAGIIYCEAGNQSYEGQVAVGAVVMNRIASGSFPDTISDVIYQSGQFTPAGSGSLDSAIASGAASGYYDAANAALAGQDPTGGCLYFNNSQGSGVKIGDHWFY